MNYLVTAFLAAIFFGFYNFFVGKAGDKITPFVATTILTFTGTIIALIATFWFRSTGGKLILTPLGIKFAVLAGATAGIAEILYFITFTKNPNISTVLPITFVITVLTGIVLSLLFNQETLTSTKFIGICLSLLALFLLAK